MGEFNYSYYARILLEYCLETACLSNGLLATTMCKDMWIFLDRQMDTMDVYIYI